MQTLTAGSVAQGMTPSDAHQSALTALDGVVDPQAAVVLPFADTFWATAALAAALVLAWLPLVLLLGKAARGAKVELGH